MVAQKDAEIPFTDLYVYNLKDEVLSSLKLMYFDSLTSEQKTEEEYLKSKPLTLENLTLHNTIVKPVRPRPVKTIPETKPRKEDPLSDFERYNKKRTSSGLTPLTEEEFENTMDQLSISDSDMSISQSEDDDNNEYYKKHLESIGEGDVAPDEESSISFLNTKSPFVLFDSSLLAASSCFGVYKTTLNASSLNAEPTKFINSLNQYKSDLKNKMSALFMMGGGHFAGAIISHQPKNVKGNKGTTEELKTQSVHLIEQKTFHRYTTRRKQGGSQSASDNAKGKAKSAGSNLRRYNEQALTKEVRELLAEWKPMLDKCDHIFIKASGSSSHKAIVGYLNSPIKGDDKRVRIFPFTTKRPTTSELKRAWCELSYLKIMDVPKINKEQVQKMEKQREALLKSKTQLEEKKHQNVDQEVKTTKEIIALVKRLKAPALISYIRNNKIDPNFKLQPESEYINTPTLLHFASHNGFNHMCQILLNNLKCDPTIQNKFGKTAYELAAHDQTRYVFQVARSNLGDSYCDWENGAKVLESKTRDEVEKLEKEKAEETSLEQQRLMQEGLAKARLEMEQERVSKYGSGKTLAPPKATEEQNLNTLTPEQKLRVLREQRARAAEARMKKLGGS